MRKAKLFGVEVDFFTIEELNKGCEEGFFLEHLFKENFKPKITGTPVEKLEEYLARNSEPKTLNNDGEKNEKA